MEKKNKKYNENITGQRVLQVVNYLTGKIATITANVYACKRYRHYENYHHYDYANES